MGMAGFEPASCGMVTGFPLTACRPVGRAATFFTTALPSELHSHSCPSFRAATGFCILPPFLKSRKSHLGSIPGKHPHLALCLPREAPLTPLDFRASIGGRSFPAVIRHSPNVTPARLRCFVESSSPASESPQPLVYCVKELHKPVKTVSWCAGPELNRLR